LREEAIFFNIKSNKIVLHLLIYTYLLIKMTFYLHRDII